MDAERAAAQMAEALQTGGLAVGTDRTPKFGEWLRGIWASPRNPHRDGMYVRTVRRTGRLNPGVWYELTDGKGAFWQYEAKGAVFIEAPNDLGQEPCAASSRKVACTDGFGVRHQRSAVVPAPTFGEKT